MQNHGTYEIGLLECVPPIEQVYDNEVDQGTRSEQYE